MLRASVILAAFFGLAASGIGGDLVAMQTARWDRAEIRKEKVHFAEGVAAAVKRGQARYEAVARETGVPWQVIGCIHNMECGLSFREHLHNGDPLTGRTRHVPAGRPLNGRPPFAWEFSAVDAIRLDRLDREHWSAIGNWLQNIEAYNGTGYERFHPDVPTPYLWSWTTLYVRGKYIEDGRWSSTAASEQCGVVPILRYLR